jgi:IS30 family transposase
MYKHLTHYELYYIWRHYVQDFIKPKVSDVAHYLGKHKATIYRAITYIKKNNWSPIDINADKFRTRNKIKFNDITDKMKSYISEKLKIGWSPDVISGKMKKNIGCIISFKTIYRYIWQNKSTGGDLYKLLPHQGKKYKSGSSKRTTIVNRVDISQRPKIVEEKTRIGDFEGDTIVGARGGDKACLLTLVDRASKYTIIRKIPNKTAIAVEKSMNDCYDNTILPFLTVTYDNGTEFSNHKNIANNLHCDIYFARPYKSCDRGLNEHTNGLIRRFFPKKTDFGAVTDQEIKIVQDLLNDRPRKTLHYLTPNEVINKQLNKAYKKCRTLLDNGRIIILDSQQSARNCTQRY